jgi:hypothetical protein
MVKKKQSEPGRPRVHRDMRRRVTLTLPEAILTFLQGNRTEYVEQLLRREAFLHLTEQFSHLLRLSNPIILDIEEIPVNTLSDEDWEKIRGSGCLVGNAPVNRAWLVEWKPQRCTHDHRWQILIVDSISPLNGQPAYLTTPARSRIPLCEDV